MYMPRFNADVQRQTPKEEAPMTTASSVTPIKETPKQPQQRQTAKDIIAANVKSRFHNYSFGNILEIARQRPTATRVAGLYAWYERRSKNGPQSAA